jgi:purine-binding chemotaxis protein CheW
VQVLAFDVGGLACAVGASQVREVLEPRPVTLVPGAPPAAPAVFALRGRIVTVIDLALRLGVAPSRRRPEWLVVEGPADVGMCALETEGVIGLSSVDPAALARPRGLAAAEDLLRGITLQPDGPLLVLDLDRILDAEAVRRTRVSRTRAQRPARSAPVASGRSAPVAPSNGLSPSPPQRDPPLVTIALAPALPASRVPPRLAAPRPAARGSLPATRSPATRAPGASLAGAVGGPPPEASRSEAPPASPGAGSDEGHGPEEDVVDRRDAIRSRHRFHGGVLGAAAVVAVALVALLVRWSATPRVAPDARAVAPAPIHRSIERGVVDSSVPAAPQRLAPLSTPGPSTSGSSSGPVAVQRTPPPASFVVVARGDSLWRLAGVHLGARSAWPRLHDLNRGVIADPDLIVPGQHLALPAEGR